MTIRHWSLVAAVAACPLWLDPASAQDDAVARELVVSIQGGGERGAGVIVGRDGDSLYIVTAAHVVAEDGIFEPTAQVMFGDGSTAIATVDTMRATRDLELDLAILSVSPPAGLALGPIPDRLGDLERLRHGDRVYAIGCPGSVSRCWEISADEDEYQATYQLIAFHSQSIEGGSSGGALFNNQWEVIGIVLSRDPPFGQALPIDIVRDELADRSVPFQLTVKAVPRDGYGTSMGGMLFLRSRQDGRLPSGRVSFARRISGTWSWHVAGQRLAPNDLVVTSALAGMGYDLAVTESVGLRPFAELGFGAVTSRYDIGGYFREGGQLVPTYRSLESGSAGWGAGASASFVVRGNAIGSAGIIVEAQAARWSFPTPVRPAGGTTGGPAPELDGFWWGIGVRYGLRR